MSYAPDIRNARMAVVAAALNGGRLEIGSAGMAELLAIVPLANPSGTLLGDRFTLTLPRHGVMAGAVGDAAAARLLRANGALVRDGLTVGTEPLPGAPYPDVVVSSTQCAPGIFVVIDELTLEHG